MTAPTAQLETELRCTHCEQMLGAFMVYEGLHLCLECAARSYELGVACLMPAWLLVHGRELDKCGKSR